MITTIRKLAPDDDLNIVSSLIYETDKYFLPTLFEDNKDIAMRILPHMIRRNTPYNEDNIYVGLVDDKIVGIVVAFRSPIKIDVGAFFDALEGGNDSGVELMYVFDADKKLTGIVAERLEIALKEYFFPLENEGNGYYISSICVDESYREQGIGNELLDGVLPCFGKELDVYVDCAVDNHVALEMYGARGFETLFTFERVRHMTYHKLIRRANRETIIQQRQNEEVL